MLRTETVVPEMLEVLKELQSNPLFFNFYLAGGTSLALQLGHRTSTDIDLFSYSEQNFVKIIQYLNKHPDKYKIDEYQEGFIRLYTNGIKVELIYDDMGKLIKEPKNIDGIIFLDKSEIAPMKLKAITGRTKSRDLIDFAYLLQEMSLENIFNLYKEKYGAVNINILKRELLFKSKIINEDDWLIGIKMIKNDIKPQNIPNIIKQSIDEYNISIGINSNKTS
ncbi:MAG: nucleotidyl transferase AbiEii/AbiGii toxin family protein [Treponema sp.]|nr:nucleotidyl transferase AbiEii/AbiGii toxin family protein [Treponema sp.]